MYIDPSATSYIIQIVAGVVITCGVVVGAFWGKIKAWFMEKKIKKVEDQLKKEADEKKNKPQD